MDRNFGPVPDGPVNQLAYVPPAETAHQDPCIAQKINDYHPASDLLRQERSPRRPAGIKHAPIENKEDLSSLSAIERHSRKCQVCKHPERESIEEDFVHWGKTQNISQIYSLQPMSLYRHAHALNLFVRRRNNLRCVLDVILERGVETDITGDTILRTVRAYSCLTEDNKWVEPASQVIFSTRPMAEVPSPRANVRLNSLPQASPTIDVAVEAAKPTPQLLRAANYSIEPAQSFEPDQPGDSTLSGHLEKILIDSAND